MTIHLAGGLKDGCAVTMDHEPQYIVIPVQAPFETQLLDDAEPLPTTVFYQYRYVRKPNQYLKYHNSPVVFIPE